MDDTEVEALERLRSQLEFSPGGTFWFGYAVGPSPERARLRRAAAALAAERGVAFHLHALPPDLIPDLAHLLVGAGGGLHWIVLHDGKDGDRWEHAAGQLLLRMNERREAYLKNLGAGVVIEGAERLKVLLRNLAPDLFSIRQCALEPGVTPRLVVPRATLRALLPQPHSDAPMKNARSALDQAERLERRTGEGALRSRLGAKARAVEALLDYGCITEAEPTAEELRTEVYRAASLHLEDRWWISMVATSEELRASVMGALGNGSEAHASWRAALWIRSLLLSGVDEPERTVRERDVARCLSRLGEALIALDEEDAAEPYLERAREVRERLAAAGDAQALGELALTRSALGDLHLKREALGLAEQCFGRALKIRQTLATSYPTLRHRRHLSVAWGRISQVHERRGRLDVAMRARERSLQLALEVSAADPGNLAWQMEASVVWSLFGDVLEKADDLGAAEAAYGNALLIRESMVQADPSNPRWKRLLGIVVARLASVAHRQGSDLLAGAYARRAVEIAERLCRSAPENQKWREGLASAKKLLVEVSGA